MECISNIGMASDSELSEDSFPQLHGKCSDDIESVLFIAAQLWMELLLNSVLLFTCTTLGMLQQLEF